MIEQGACDKFIELHSIDVINRDEFNKNYVDGDKISPEKWIDDNMFRERIFGDPDTEKRIKGLRDDGATLRPGESLPPLDLPPIIPPITDDFRGVDFDYPDERYCYTSKITEYLTSEKEGDYYDDLGLEEDEVNGVSCLKNPEINSSLKDEFGRTNLERMRMGLPPVDEQGQPYELHHIGQKTDSPLAELSQSQHRGKGADALLHGKSESSVEHDGDWAKKRQDYWKARAEDFE